MKITTLLRQLSLLSLVAVAGRAQVAINFNTYVSPTNNEFVNNFSRASSAISQPAIPPNQTTTGGVTGGAVTGFASAVGADFAKFNTGQIFTSTVTTSVMFKYDSTARDPFNHQWSYVGFGLSDVTAPSLADFVGFMLQHDPVLTQSSRILASGAAHWTGVNYALFPVDGHWYQFTTGITKVGGAFNQLNLTLSVEDFGTAGTSLVSTLFNTTQAFGSAAWMGDTEVYAIFATSLGSGFVAADNFTVSAIPEPSTYAAMAGAVALVSGVLWRRRQRVLANASGAE